MDRTERGSAERDEARALRSRALRLIADGTLTAPGLAALAGQRHGLLYDLIELRYGDDDVVAVDQLRELALEAVQQLYSGQDESTG